MNPAEAKALANVLLAGIENESATTRKIVAAVPDNQMNFKLGEKGRTTRELTWHLIASEVWFADGVANGDFSQPEAPMPENATTAQMLAFYDQLPAKIARVKSLSGEQLSTPVDFFGVMKMPNVNYLGFWNNHSIHHRGQLSTYLRAMNAHVPSIYGGSADEPFQMPATA